MTTTSAQSTLKTLTDRLLANESSWGERRQAVHDIAELFSSLGIYDIHTNEREIGAAVNLSGGYAISSWGAAMCLLEVKRTYIFIKGIIAAIQSLQRNQPNKPLHILDAGCGPFALLSVLPALYVEKGTAIFHLLDVIPENIAAVKKLITALQLDDFFGDLYIADAIHFKWPKAVPLNMVISETMLNALRKEPQVAITLNLAPQLASGGLFIPENIRVDLYAVNNKLYQQDDRTPYEHFYTTLIQLNKYTQFEDGITKQLAKVKIPEEFDCTQNRFMYYTFIKVFETAVLEYNDSSLNIPCPAIKESQQMGLVGKELFFYYEVTENPSIRWRL